MLTASGNPTRFAPAVAGAIALLVYARTLLPGIAFADWGEMQTVPNVLGVAHPTGYPTYVLLAWLTELVPIGSVAFRANLLSAVLVSGAIAVTASILIRLGVGPVVAIGAALALGAVRTVWAAATVAEVNPLHLLFIALLLHRALVWADRRRRRDLVIGSLLLGLALGNHLLTVFAVPLVVGFVVWAGWRTILERPWLIAAAAGAGIVGLSVYLYIPIAASLDPPLPYNRPVTLEAVWWLVSGEQFRDQFDFLAADGPETFVRSLPSLWSLLLSRATAVVPVLGAVGLLVLIRRRPAFGLTCAAILVVHVYIWANYLELEHYLLVPWLLLALGTGIALDAIGRLIGRWLERFPGRLLGARRAATGWRAGFGTSGSWMGAVAALLLALGLGATNWAASDRSGDHGGDEYVNAVMTALPENAAIVSVWDESTPLWYARFVLGLRPDVLVVDDTNIVYEGWGTREARIATLICDRPVFLARLNDRDLVATREDYRLEPFMSVRVGYGGPVASVTREIYRVLPRDPSTCPG